MSACWEFPNLVFKSWLFAFFYAEALFCALLLPFALFCGLAFSLALFQKTREGCGCPKFLAAKVFGQISTLLENSSPIFRQHEILSLARFGHFPARKTAAGKLAAPSGTLLDFLLRDRHNLLEFFCAHLRSSHSLRIYPYPMVWPLPRPWSETMASIPL